MEWNLLVSAWETDLRREVGDVVGLVVAEGMRSSFSGSGRVGWSSG